MCASVPSPADDRDSQNEQIALKGFYVRRGMFRDLRDVAELMMEAFYQEGALMFHYHRMLELDRLQSNFPYDSSRHEFYVACGPTGEVVGFVDVDGRKSMRYDAPPRPYLSDLAVKSDWRRMGVATSLIEMCEVRAREIGHKSLYLRVEQSNEAALRMYSDLGYEKKDHRIFGVKDTTQLLKCKLEDRLDTPSTVQTGGGEQEEDAEPEEGAGAKNTLAADIVVDYSEPEEAVGVNSTLAADAVLDYSV